MDKRLAISNKELVAQMIDRILASERLAFFQEAQDGKQPEECSFVDNFDEFCKWSFLPEGQETKFVAKDEG
jgi:hypothetical protein